MLTTAVQQHIQHCSFFVCWFLVLFWKWVTAGFSVLWEERGGAGGKKKKKQPTGKEKNHIKILSWALYLTGRHPVLTLYYHNTSHCKGFIKATHTYTHPHTQKHTEKWNDSVLNQPTVPSNTKIYQWNKCTWQVWDSEEEPILTTVVCQDRSIINVAVIKLRRPVTMTKPILTNTAC